MIDSRHVGGANPVRALWGPRRMCWGSGYPVSRQPRTYQPVHRDPQNHCTFMPECDREQILGDTLNGVLTPGQTPVALSIEVLNDGKGASLKRGMLVMLATLTLARLSSSSLVTTARRENFR